MLILDQFSLLFVLFIAVKTVTRLNSNITQYGEILISHLPG